MPVKNTKFVIGDSVRVGKRDTLFRITDISKTITPKLARLESHSRPQIVDVRPLSELTFVSKAGLDRDERDVSP